MLKHSHVVSTHRAGLHGSAAIAVWRRPARSTHRSTEPLAQLGASGGRIVAEVLIGILEADRGSYRANEPSWTPTLPARGKRFGLTDILLATDESDR